MDNKILELLNPEFEFNFNGKIYRVKGASLEKSALFRQRAQELKSEPDYIQDVKLSAYAIYLVLIDVDNTITEDYVFKNTPGNIEVLDLLVTLGFMSPQKGNLAKKVEAILDKKLTTDSSSAS